MGTNEAIIAHATAVTALASTHVGAYEIVHGRRFLAYAMSRSNNFHGFRHNVLVPRSPHLRIQIGPKLGKASCQQHYHNSHGFG